MQKDQFTTFDAVEVLKINRNTLQSAIDGNFIVPDIAKAKKKGEKSLFSLNGLCTIRLFMDLVNNGRSRSEASRDLQLNWDAVGLGKNEYQYLIVAAKRLDPPLLYMGESSLCSKMPKDDLGSDDVFRMVVNLAGTKEYVIRRVGEVFGG
jgi:hypothetical protein